MNYLRKTDLQLFQIWTCSAVHTMKPSPTYFPTLVHRAQLSHVDWYSNENVITHYPDRTVYCERTKVYYSAQFYVSISQTTQSIILHFEPGCFGFYARPPSLRTLAVVAPTLSFIASRNIQPRAHSLFFPTRYTPASNAVFKSAIRAGLRKTALQSDLLSSQLFHLFVEVTAETTLAATATLSDASASGETSLRAGYTIVACRVVKSPSSSLSAHQEVTKSAKTASIILFHHKQRCAGNAKPVLHHQLVSMRLLRNACLDSLGQL